MDRQTLRDWAHRFNTKGPEGLINGKAPGPSAKLFLRLPSPTFGKRAKTPISTEAYASPFFVAFRL
jgi:hypothetical protein